jgi:DNA polymerase-4
MGAGPRQILHVDMDAFYASVEQRDDPSLRGRPVIVGGPSKRGVVCAASYEVRPFGVRSAMPMADAMRRCPHAAVVAPRMGHYAEVSHQVFDIFSRYTPLCEGLSLDEAFLDVTASRALFGDGARIATAIRDAIRSELSLTASAGVATNKFIAKIASDMKKPDGLVEVPAGEERAFLAPLAVERMWGVGPKAAAALHAASIRTIGDLASAHPRRVAGALGTKWGEVIVRLARGEDERDVHPDRAAVSMGAEETFEEDIRTTDAALERMLAQTERVVRRLTAHELAARIVVIKIKYADFRLVSRRATVPEPICDTPSIFAVVRELVQRAEIDGCRVRLTGVSLGGLVERGAGTTSLFPDAARTRREQLEQTLQAVRNRFGDDSVGRGRAGKR